MIRSTRGLAHMSIRPILLAQHGAGVPGGFAFAPSACSSALFGVPLAHPGRRTRPAGTTCTGSRQHLRFRRHANDRPAGAFDRPGIADADTRGGTTSTRPASAPAGGREVSIASGIVVQRFAEKTGALLESRVVRDATVSLKRRQADGKTGPVGMSFRWTGLIHVPQAGRYAFHVEAAGDATAWVGKRIVVQRHRVPAPGDGEPTIELNAGYYPLSVAVSDLFGGEEVRVQLQWKPPGAEELTGVPAASLFHIVKNDSAPTTAAQSKQPEVAVGPATAKSAQPTPTGDVPAVAAVPPVPPTPPANLAALYDLNAAPPNAPPAPRRGPTRRRRLRARRRA